MQGVVVRALGIWAGLALMAGSTPVLGQNCEGNNFTSTFAAIQKVIFENRGCLNNVCHGADPGTGNGGLDLRPDVAYANLVSKPAETVPGWYRVFPGQRDRSLLFLNLAAKTLPDQYSAPLRAMPLDPLPAISTDELEALRKWVEVGAPHADGMVPAVPPDGWTPAVGEPRAGPGWPVDAPGTEPSCARPSLPPAPRRAAGTQTGCSERDHAWEASSGNTHHHGHHHAASLRRTSRPKT